MAKQNDEWSSYVLDLGKSAFWLSTTKMAMAGATQPLLNLKNLGQSWRGDKPLSMLQTVKLLVNQPNPIRASFKGAVSGGLKEAGKNGIKGPFIKGAPDVINYISNHWMPKELYIKNPYLKASVHAVACGSFAGLSENILIGWAERFTTFRSTSQGELANASYMKELGAAEGFKGKVGFIYKGFIPSTIKSTLALSMYFAATPFVKLQTASLFDLSVTQPKPWYVMGVDVMTVAFLVAIVSTPVDVVKTQAQSPLAKEAGLFNALSTNYKERGLSGLSAGLKWRLVLACLGWMATGLAMEFSGSNNNTPNNTPRI